MTTEYYTASKSSILSENQKVRMVIPPPIIRLSSTFDKKDLKPAVSETTKSEKLMTSMLSFNPPASSVITAVNSFIENIDKQMNARPIIHPKGMVVVLRAECDKPTFKEGDTIIKMTPSYAINNELNYQFSFKAKFAIRHMISEQKSELVAMTTRTRRGRAATTGTEQRLTQIDHSNYQDLIPIGKDYITCGEIPCIIGSSTCNLTDEQGNYLPPQELAKLGFCENDLFGYTVIGGNKVAVILQEVLRKNMPIIMMNDDLKEYTIRLTSRASSGSTYVVSIYQQNNILYLDTSVLRKDGNKKQLNLFSAFKLLGMYDEDEAENIILSMVNAPIGSSYYQTIKQILAQTRSHNIYSLEAIFQDILKSDNLFTLDDLYDKMINSIFPHIDKSTEMVDTKISLRKSIKDRKFKREDDKIYLAAYMTAYYLDFLSGYNPNPDNRDSWTIKALESAGTQYEKIFAGVWNEVASQIEAKIYDKPLTEETVKREILSVLSNTSEFSRSFRRKFMGLKTYTSDGDNFAQFIKDDTLLSPYVYLNKISPKIDENAKQSVRMVQPTQNGYVCYVATPENKRCGLIKFLAIGAKIANSSNRSDSVNDILVDKLSRTKSQENNITFYHNYVLRGYGNTDTYNLLKKYRREMIIPEDTAIVYNRKHSSIHILTTNNRLCRPLLIVDDNGNLVLDTPKMIEGKETNLWELDFKSMMKHGALEYVDAWEESTLLVAQDMNVLYTAKKAYRDGLEHHKKIKASYSSLQDAYNRVKDKLTEDLTSRFTEKLKSLESQLKEAAHTLERLELESRYTHCELDPSMNFSFQAALIPFPDHNPGPRNTFQCKMGDQVIGELETTGMNKLSKEKRKMIYPERPIVETPIGRAIGMNVAPSGHPVSFVIKTDPWNQEDSIKANLDAMEFGMFNYIQYSVYERELAENETLGHPSSIPSLDNTEEKYDYLDENGLPKIGTLLKKGDVLMNVIKQKQWQGNTIKMNSKVSITPGREGRVDFVHYYMKITDGDSKTCVRIRLQYYGQPDMGDKFASRSAQKGTGSSYQRRYELPWTLIERDTEVIKSIESKQESKRLSLCDLPTDNIKYIYDYTTGKITKTPVDRSVSKKRVYKFVPTVVMNPHSIPSRMTIGKMIEIISSSYGLTIGARINGAAFQKFNTSEFMKLIKDAGMKTAGMYIFKDPITGRNDASHVFAGTVHYNTLKHFIKDKIQSRATGKVDPISKQPLGGRTREGGSGLKFGEMEKDGIICYGASNILHDKTCVSSDQIKILVCKKCKKYGNIYMRGDTYICGICNQSDIVGTFLPHNFKLVMESMSAASVKFEITTE